MLIGRTAECGRIDRLLADLRAGAGSALLLIGEPGIGKTALLEYACRQAPDLRRLDVLGVEADQALAYAGLHELLTPVLDRVAELPERQARAIAVALGSDDGGEMDALAVYGGVLAVLSEAASLEPVLAIVDDAHWLDAETVQAIGFAARRIANESLGIIVAARSREQFELRGVEQLQLGGVDPAAATALIAGVRPELPPEVSRALRDQVSGNPLALLELTAAIEEDVINGRRPLDDSLAVTAAVEQAFLRRTEQLSDAGRLAMLLAAASDGVDLAIIQGVGSAVADGLDEAERGGLLRVTDGRIAFWHPLVRSAVYTAATDRERRDAHRALAAGLPDRQAARRAWHLVAAGAQADEAVASSLADAGQAARRAGACASAARLLDTAASVTPDAELRAKRLLYAGESAWLAGEPRRARALLDRSDELTADAELSAEIAVARWWTATSDGSPKALFEPLVQHAAELAAEHPHKAASMLAIAWDWAVSSLDVDGARALVDRAEQLVRGDIGPRDRELLTAIAWQRLADCRVTDGLAAARLAIELSRTSQDIQVAFAAEALSAADVLEEAHAALADATAALTRQGHLPALAYTLRARATVELRRGQTLQALKTAGEAQVLADEGIASFQGYVDAAIAAVEAVAGSEDACRSHVARALEAFGGEDRWTRAEGLGALGLLELGVGNDDAARLALDEVAVLLVPIRHPGFIRFAADRIETLVRTGDERAARIAIGELAPRIEAAAVPWATHIAARSKVLIAPAEDLDAAYERVLAAPTHSRFEACRSSLVYGERLRRAGRRVDARDQLRRALDGFHDLGAERWERRAQAELRASGARLRKRDVSARDQLTPQELQVALVVAEGVTNREAAARLFLSPKTIEVHLSRAYRKLGVRTRTELSRRLAFHGASELSLPRGRTLATVLFTDIVKSTDRASQVGDERWSIIINRHNRTAEAAIERHNGRLVKSTGDGVLATFDTPTAAVRCAFALGAALRKLDIQIRAAAHAGELDRSPDGDIHGIAVHIAARVLGQANAGEVLVTQTVRDTAHGSSLAFLSRGVVELTGVGPWELFVARAD